MSSPVTVPRRRRSFAGPVVLILLGIFFLLGTMGFLHWQHIGQLFAKFWPLFLIIWGIIKLLEYQQAQREGARAPGIGAGGVFLVICLIVFGLIATQASHVNWHGVADEINLDTGDFPFFGNSYNYNDELSQPFPAGGNLRIVNERGAVNVSTSDGDVIKVVVRKKVWGEDQKSADKGNSQSKPQITVSGSTVTLNANTGGAGDRPVATDMDVSIPRKASVTVSSKRGDVNITGREANLEITSQHGDVSLEDVTGNASLNLDRSSARIERIAGDVSIDGHANDISISDVKGAVHLTGEFMESVKLSKIAKAVTFKSSRTDMEFSSLNGDLDLDSGDLRADSVGGPVRLLTRSKDIRLENVSGDVRLDDENGSVEVGLTSLGNVQIQNRKGDIQITVPGKAGFQVDARTRDGDIQSDFPEVKIESRDEQSIGTGTVGNGGARLVITNEHGTIELRKGTSVAAVVPAPPTPPVPPGGPKAPRLPAPKEKPVEPTEN